MEAEDLEIHNNELPAAKQAPPLYNKVFDLAKFVWKFADYTIMIDVTLAWIFTSILLDILGN